MPDYEAVIDGQKYKVSFPQEPTDADFKSAIVGFQKARGSTSALPPAPVSSTVGIIPSKFDLLAAKGVKLHDPLAQLFADRKAIAAANPAMPRQQVIDRANRIAHVRALAKEAGRGVVFGNDVTEGPGSTPIKRGVPSMSVGDVTGGGGNAQEVSPGDAALTYLGVPMNQEDYPNTFMGQAAHRLTQLPGGLTEPKSLAIGAGAALATAAFPPAGVPIALGFGAQQGYSGGQQLAQGRPGAAAVDATMGMLAALGAARHASGLKRTSAVEPAPISDVATLGDPESIIRSAERAAAKNGPGEVPAPRPLTKEEAAFAALSPKKQAAARVKMEKEAAALLARSKAQQSEVDRLMQSNLDPNTPAYTKTPPLDVATGTREGFNEVGRLPQDTESTLFRQRFGIQSQEAPPVEPAIGQSPANPPPVNTTPAPFARPTARPTLLDATQEVPNALPISGAKGQDVPVSKGGQDSPLRGGRSRQGQRRPATAGTSGPQEAPGEVPAATGQTEVTAPAKGPQAPDVDASVSNTDTTPVPSKFDAAVADAVAQLGRGEKLNPSEIAAKHGLSGSGAEEAIKQSYEQPAKSAKTSKIAATAERKAFLEKEITRKVNELAKDQTINSFLDPTIYPRVLRVAKMQAELAGITFKEWASKMVEKFGEPIRRDLERIWSDLRVLGVKSALAEDRPAAPAWRSDVERVISEKMQNTAPSGSVLAMLKNSGISPDELKWNGLDDLLQSKKSITKAEVLHHIADNSVQVTEVERGAPSALDKKMADMDRQIAEFLENASKHALPDDIYNQRWDDLHRQWSALEAERRAENNDPKFPGYQMPGAEPGSYRELLLTKPTETTMRKAWVNKRGDFMGWVQDDHLTPENTQLLESQGLTQRDIPLKGDGVVKGYHSPHWDEPNVLAHVRFNERKGPNGERILHVEEIQSDWHQEGRKKGYVGGEGDPASVVNKWLKQNNPGVTEGEVTYDDLDRWGAPDDVLHAKYQAVSGSHLQSRVPDAPFSKTWHELAAKRVLKYAADNGYDSVSWSPGDVQNERYDLSKQVKQVNYTPKTGRLTAVGFSSETVMAKDGIPSEKLADYIGKEAAEKIINSPTKVSGDIHVLQGDDLKVGGSGMKGFYDKILPDTFNKIGKQYGSRVGTTELHVPSEGFSESDLRISLPDRMGVYHIEGPEGRIGLHFSTLAEAKDYVKSRAPKPSTVPSIPITDALRSSAKSEGFPAFSGMKRESTQSEVSALKKAESTSTEQIGVEKARAELKAKLNKLSSGLDPVLLLKLAKLGAEHLKAGVKTFGEFSKRMADEYGPVIKPYMKKLWADANTIHAGGTIKEKPIPAAIANMAAYRDQARNHFQQNQSYTQRVAPDTSKALTRLAAARDIVEAETARVQEVFDKRKMSPEMRQAYGALLAEDRNANLGTHTFDPASRLQTPGMQSLTRDYNAAEGAIFPKYRQSGGYGDTQSRGRTSKAFMPLLPAEFAESYGVSKGGRPTTRTIAELARMPGEKQFKGKLNSTNAITDPVEAIRVRLSKLIPQSELRNVLQSAKAEGVLREVPADFDGTMDVNGHSVPAQRVKIADRFSVSAKEMKEMGLPNEAVMPSQILHEVDPVLSGIKSPARGPGGPLNILIRGYLFAPGDVGAHTFTLSSLGRASQKTAISTGFPPLDNILSSVGTLRTLAGLKDVFNLTHSKADRIQANLLAARAGVFKGLPDVEPTTKVGQAVYGAARKMGMPEKVDLTSPGGYVLYGPRGVYSNAITGVYKMMKATGATDAEIENAFRTLPSHLESSQPTAQKLLNVVGMGTFYQTGTKALSAGLKYGLQPKRLLATATFLTVAGAAADFEHKPWYDKDRKLLPGQFATGKEGNRYVLGDLRFDRTARVAMETPFRVVQAVQQGATPAEAAERGVYSAANQLIRPAFSGPVASAGSRLAGVAPYIVPSDKIRGPAAMPDVMANKSLSDRAKSLGSTVLPISNLVLGDPGEELRSNAPKSQGYSVASKVLKGLGQPPIRTVKPGAAEAQILRIRNSRNSQERSADARANRK